MIPRLTLAAIVSKPHLIFVAILVALFFGCLPFAAMAEPQGLASVLDGAARLKPLKAVIVAEDGTVLAERGYRGHKTTSPTNIKSVSKSIVAALVGIAMDKGLLQGPDQRIATLLVEDLPAQRDPRLERITVGNLLSMQAGLARTSGANYGRWVNSRNWVRSALAQPFVDEPGGVMLYSTGSTHLLSAILTRVSGRSTLALAREWLGPAQGFAIANWTRDPQGVYLGGNEMAMTPRSLLVFGELYRNGGKNAVGRQVIPAAWIGQSWMPRTESQFTGDAYGYGWFLRQVGGVDVRYGWGYGGQMLYVVPSKKVTVVMVSDANSPSGRTGYRDELHDLLRQILAAL